MFLPLAAGYVTALCTAICGILYWRTHEPRGPFLETRKKQSDERLDLSTFSKPYASEKAE